MKSQSDLIQEFKELASIDLDHLSLAEEYSDYFKEAILIREVENSFLELFSQGKLNGTVHTCVGQELSAVAIGSNLKKDDWITSNHRCHGHFISKTKLWKPLIDELRGLSSGVCKGIGSSQHLYYPGFLSNGPQGSLLPVGAGIAKYFTMEGANNIVTSFIGEGTLGEGNLYETLNLSSVLNLPQLFVLENNLYSQSTPQASAVSGEIGKRAEAFNIETFECNTWDIQNLFRITKQAVDYVRDTKKPAFLTIKTYRLNAHSKSDDDRDINEIKYFEERDPLNLISTQEQWESIFLDTKKEIQNHINESEESFLDIKEYLHDQLPRKKNENIAEISNDKERMVKALNRSYFECLKNNSVFIGEDISDPYGGAFKVTKGFSSEYPESLISSPISEAGITGMGIGLSLMGKTTFVEIMFGDFATHIFDQLISNASKFYHMYAFQCSAPVRVRTPMGGKRGYGPTHSQSLEKLFLGIDNLLVVSLSSLEDPKNIINEVQEYKCPALIIENKVDYGKILFQDSDYLKIDKIGGPLGIIRAYPVDIEPNIIIVSYGGTARELVDSAIEIFKETDLMPEIFCLTMLHPLDIEPIIKSLRENKKDIFIVEDHSSDFGIGSEIISKINESDVNTKCYKIGAEPYPIPSVRSLEDKMLTTLDRVISEIKRIKASL